MSRAYRIRVRETLNRVVRAEDHVSTQLELLEILAPEQMAELFAQELVRRGFERQAESLVRTADGVTVTVDPAMGNVVVRAAAEEELRLESSRHGLVVEESGKRGKRQEQQRLKKELRQSLESQAQQEAKRLQTQLTDRLESQLSDLRAELGQAVNRTTAEALKRRAAQIGRIKEMTEDPQTGSLTIVVEV